MPHKDPERRREYQRLWHITHRENCERSRSKYRKRNNSIGRCQSCPKPATNGTRCEVHYNKQVAMRDKYQWKAAEQQNRLDNRLCTSCGRKLIDEIDLGYKSCLNCREGLKRGMGGICR
jgi:1,4-alpha-glucan branching enzyme